MLSDMVTCSTLLEIVVFKYPKSTSASTSAIPEKTQRFNEIGFTLLSFNNSIEGFVFCTIFAIAALFIDTGI